MANQIMKLNVPEGSWDTHIHVFDQSRFPFKGNRQYTPESVHLYEVVDSTIGQNLVLVQASFEGTFDGILTHLEEAHREYPERQFRAEIIWDPRIIATTDRIDHLHRLGVRCLRIHAEHGTGDGTDFAWVKRALQTTTSVAERHGWAVAAQLPLSTWLALGPEVIQSRCPVIVEHLGSPPPAPMDLGQWKQFQAFVDMVSDSQHLSVKVSGLYRRVGPEEPLQSAAPLVRALADRAPWALLYGSDFPHVDVRFKSLHVTKLLEVDRELELAVIRSAMGDRAWQMMLVDNPARLFG